MTQIQYEQLEFTGKCLLKDKLGDLEGTTMLTSEQICSLRNAKTRKGKVMHPHLRQAVFSLADGVVYAPNGSGSYTIYITAATHNPVLKSPREKIGNLDGLYRVSDAELSDIVNAAQEENSEVTTIDMSKLTLQGDENEGTRYVYWSTTTYKTELQGEDLKLAEAFYGKGTLFDEHMKMLSNAGIKETWIKVLNPLCGWLPDAAKEKPIACNSMLLNLFAVAYVRPDNHSEIDATGTRYYPYSIAVGMYKT